MPTRCTSPLALSSNSQGVLKASRTVSSLRSGRPSGNRPERISREGVAAAPRLRRPSAIPFVLWVRCLRRLTIASPLCCHQQGTPGPTRATLRWPAPSSSYRLPASIARGTLQHSSVASIGGVDHSLWLPTCGPWRSRRSIGAHCRGGQREHRREWWSGPGSCSWPATACSPAGGPAAAGLASAAAARAARSGAGADLGRAAHRLRRAALVLRTAGNSSGGRRGRRSRTPPSRGPAPLQCAALAGEDLQVLHRPGAGGEGARAVRVEAFAAGALVAARTQSI